MVYSTYLTGVSSPLLSSPLLPLDVNKAVFLPGGGGEPRGATTTTTQCDPREAGVGVNTREERSTSHEIENPGLRKSESATNKILSASGSPVRNVLLNLAHIWRSAVPLFTIPAMFGQNGGHVGSRLNLTVSSVAPN